jgi:hypothetical protein
LTFYIFNDILLTGLASFTTCLNEDKDMLIKVLLCGFFLCLAAAAFLLGESSRRYLRRGGYTGQSGSAKEAADGCTGGVMVFGYFAAVMAVGVAVFLYYNVPGQ